MHGTPTASNRQRTNREEWTLKKWLKEMTAIAKAKLMPAPATAKAEEPAASSAAAPFVADCEDYLDALAGARAQLRLWRSIATWTCCGMLPLSILCVFLVVQNISNLDRTKFILSPAVERFEIATVDQVTDSYIQAAFEHVASRNSSWTFESIEENYDDLFKNYYSQDLVTRTKANLAQSDRVSYVKQNKMVSTFKIDREKSEYTWCAALNLACGLVVGKEGVFIDGNQPYRSEEVAYLIFSESIYPTRTNPFAIRVTRLAIGDYEPLRKALTAAKEGRLPDEIASKQVTR